MCAKKYEARVNMIHRRSFSTGLSAALAGALVSEAFAHEGPAPEPPLADPPASPPQPAAAPDNQQGGATYSEDEIVRAAGEFFDTTAGAVGAVIERIFRDQGRPVGYSKGQEGSGAWALGLRYGEGDLYLRDGSHARVFWQGPTVGFDFGGNASKVFTLVYGMSAASQIYRRFPGVEGSAYLIGGIGVNYQKADEITLAPMRSGAGLRLGASVGYLAYSRRRRINPF
jgi:hypothetical protein